MKPEKFTLPAASHLFLISENNILLHLRKNSSFEGLYGLIAGHLDGNEPASDAMIREAKEEVGIEIDRNDLKISAISHSKANNKEYIQFFFVCKKWKGEIKNAEPHKCDELKFFPIDSLPENIIPYIKKAIECHKNNISYFEEGWEDTL